MKVLGLLRAFVWLKRIAIALEQMVELKEVELDLRPEAQYRKDRIVKKKSSVEISVASIEERDKSWREEHGQESL